VTPLGALFDDTTDPSEAAGLNVAHTEVFRWEGYIA
jgi:hypothetical protein